ncbi:MAG: MFS transporter [Candidatus Dormibacteria bacterium]
MTARGYADRTFRALHNRNYRLFFFGQIVSVSGTWMQSVGQAWLVLKLTNSGTALGLIIALQTLPVLLGAPWGGVVADRFDKRRVLVGTQAAAAVLAALLGILTLTGAVQLWMVGALAFGLGMVNMVDIPTRQSFVLEMVGREHLVNAITLNSVVMNGARIVGPAIAAVLIATVGIAPCFLGNAVSYVAVIGALLAIRDRDLHRGAPPAKAPGQLLEGFRYVWRTPALRTPLLTMAVVGTFAYEFQVTLPLLARFTFHAGASGYGALSSLMGAGAVVGGLVTAAIGRASGRRLAIAAAVFGLLIIGCALAPTFASELVMISITGAASIFFAAMANTTIQLAAAPQMRGRVMALYSMAFMGSTPIGGPIVGFIGQAVEPRAALGLGGLAALVAAILAWRSLSRLRPAAVPGVAPVAA